MRKAAAADDAHIVGQVGLDTIRDAFVVSLLQVGPGIRLEFVPVGDGAGVLVNILATIGALQVRRVVGDDPMKRHINAFQPATNVVIAEETLDDDLTLEFEIGVSGVQPIEKIEPLTDCFLNFRVEE